MPRQIERRLCNNVGEGIVVWTKAVEKEVVKWLDSG